MDRMAVILVLCLTALMLLTGVINVAASEPVDDERASESRGTPIDGSYRDDFSDPGNMTLYEDAGIIDGELLVDRAIIRDRFERAPLAPWEVVVGDPRIVQGVLLTNGTETLESHASIAFDLPDLEIELDFSPGLLGTGGPILNLSGQGPDTLIGKYSSGSQEIQLWRRNATGDHLLESAPLALEMDMWYSLELSIQGSEISFIMGPNFVEATYDFQGNFQKLTLGSSVMESAAWDNVTIRKMGGSGYGISKAVDLPEDTFWTGLTMMYKRVPSTTLKISLVDPTTGQALTGLDDITSSFVDLEDKLDPTVVTSVALRVEMTAIDTRSPSVQRWKIEWEGDPPVFIKPHTQVTLKEDEDREKVIDLRKHFEDRFTDDDNLTFSVAWTSNPTNVLPVVDGYWLGFQLPKNDFFGTEYYTIRCSDGILSTDGLQGTVVVNPVDDPPTVRSFPGVDMYEDEEFELNMTPYLDDVDTPVEVLRLRAMSDNARVEGQMIYLNYDRSGDHTIELVISDYSNDVQFMLDVSVREVDDAPVFTEPDRVAVFEDVERTIDLAEYISDEDDLLEELLIDIENPDRYISINGTNLTLYYDDTGGEFEYVILVSDERSTVNQTLLVSVREVNDPPRVVSVADMVPVKDQVFWTMTEGNTSDLPIVVEDEESKSFQFTLVGDMEGARMLGATLRLETEEGQVGTYRLQVSITDGGAATVVKVEVDVTNRNDPVQDAAISEPTNGTRIQLGTLVTLKGYAFDPDFAFKQVLNYSWSSDLDGPLGHGKNLEGVNLTEGDHVITLVVTDGEYSDEAQATVTVFKKGGGGGGGGGGSDDDGIGETGMSILLMIGIVIALVIVGVIIFAVRSGSLGGSEQVTFSEPPPQEDDVPSAAEAHDKPPERPEEVKVPKPKEPELTEAEMLYGKRTKAAEPAAAPAAEPAAAEASKPKYEAVAVDTAKLAEADPEQRHLDDMKRKYQAAISALPFGVPSSELASMDWYELAKAMAEGEHKTLDDGKTVVNIGDSWYYADPEDTDNFLRRHA